MFQKITRLLALACLIAISFSACKTVKMLQSAQSSFNKAAQAEQLYRTNRTAPADLPEDAEQLYQSAFNDIVKALTEEEAKLKKTGGYGQALAIKALSAWRLQDYVVARTTASQAYQALKNSKANQPRELALTAAMDGFIELEMAYDSMTALRKHLMEAMNSASRSPAIFDRCKQHYTKNIWNDANAKGYVESGLQRIEAARAEAKNEADVQRYLTYAQLTGLKTWSDELQEIRDVAKSLRLMNNVQVSSWLSGQNEQFETERKRVLLAYAQQVEGGVDGEAYKTWSQALVGIQ